MADLGPSAVSKLSTRHIVKLLEDAGVTVDGQNPWDIHVLDRGLFKRLLRSSSPSLALGEEYLDGAWDSPRLDEFFYRIIRAGLADAATDSALAQAARWLIHLTNKQKKSRAFKIGEHHYDIGNDIYQAMLDKRLTYTCGYWAKAKNLDESQEEKLDLVCRKIELKKGMRVLDIGCGWGSFAKFAAEKYGASVVGVTVSKRQVELGTKLVSGLPVELRLQDYRDVTGSFDAIVSLGMFEHVGSKNYRTFMQKTAQLLAPDGIFLLHTIGSNVSSLTGDPWMSKYIFPDGQLPSIAQIGRATEGLFVMEDWHNFGADYDKTLMAWFENFDRHWPRLKTAYDDHFYRMWKYYLLSSAGSFRARYIQLWQIALTKKGLLGGYVSNR